jgi:hypothetical protein
VGYYVTVVMFSKERFVLTSLGDQSAALSATHLSHTLLCFYYSQKLTMSNSPPSPPPPNLTTISPNVTVPSSPQFETSEVAPCTTNQAIHFLAPALRI